MPVRVPNNTSGKDPRFIAILLLVLAAAILIVTWIGIRENRGDSLELLMMQGSAFTEALAQAAESAIASENLVDFLVHLRFAEIVRGFVLHAPSELTNELAVRTVIEHDLYALYVLDSTVALVVGGVGRGPVTGPPPFVYEEAAQLLDQPELKYVLLLDEGERPGEVIHYYLEITADLKSVIVLVADAQYYLEGLRQTQIGYLAQEMAREKGVEYIIYQSTEGIIFASRKPGELLSIESDPFLSESLDSDSIRHRIYEFQGREVLELVRPFSSQDYPFGLLRVGLSLESYYTVSRGFDRLMLSLAAMMFGLILVGLLYLRSRRKRRELSVRYSRIKTATDRIFEEMRTGVAVADHDGTITMVNTAFERIFGLTETRGKKLDDIVALFQQEQPGGGFDFDSHGEKEITIERKGNILNLLVATSPLQFEESEPPGLVVVVYNITRLKRFEREANRRERLSEMGHLAAGVAHEIRNPLNTISIAAQRLAAEFIPQNGRDEYMQMTSQIRTEAGRLNEIITRFLTLAREEQRKLRPVRLDKFIQEFVQFVKSEVEQMKIVLTTELTAGCTIQADEGSLKQVFTNLYNNAKESFEGGDGRIRISTELKNDSVIIRFSDNGPGIEKSIRDKVFTPYFTTRDAGTGLGLPTVHKIIMEMGGDIRVRDADLGGAEIVITLPTA